MADTVMEDNKLITAYLCLTSYILCFFFSYSFHIFIFSSRGRHVVISHTVTLQSFNQSPTVDITI